MIQKDPEYKKAWQNVSRQRSFFFFLFSHLVFLFSHLADDLTFPIRFTSLYPITLLHPFILYFIEMLFEIEQATSYFDIFPRLVAVL